MHTSIYLYWGWYWREVYHYAPLIVAQIVFVYVLDMLVCWSRRDQWILGFGPFPIVLSTNLFLWFKDDWFFLQFLLVSTGVLCKEFITWKRDGRRTHIFNPSAIALAIFSIGLLVTHSTHITWGEEVAVSQGRPPHIYLEIFAVGLVVQALFSVTLVTLAAAGGAVCAEPGVHRHHGPVLFRRFQYPDRGLPRSALAGHRPGNVAAAEARQGRCSVRCMAALVFGSLLRAGLDGRADVLRQAAVRAAAQFAGASLLDRAGAALEARFRQDHLDAAQVNFAHMGVWIALFAVMITTGFVGGRHPGSDPEFWHKACVRKGDARLPDVGAHHDCVLPARLRDRLSHLGVVWTKDVWRRANMAESGKDFARACDLKMPCACPSLVALVKENGPQVFRPAMRAGRRRELLYSGFADLCRPGGAKGPRRSGRTVPAVLCGPMVARLRRLGRMLPRRERVRRPMRRRPRRISKRPAAPGSRPVASPPALFSAGWDRSGWRINASGRRATQCSRRDGEYGVLSGGSVYKRRSLRVSRKRRRNTGAEVYFCPAASTRACAHAIASSATAGSTPSAGLITSSLARCQVGLRLLDVDLLGALGDIRQHADMVGRALPRNRRGPTACACGRRPRSSESPSRAGPAARRGRAGCPCSRSSREVGLRVTSSRTNWRSGVAISSSIRSAMAVTLRRASSARSSTSSIVPCM